MWGLTHLHVWQKAIWQIERACWLLGVWFHSWNSMLWGVQRILHWLIFICEIVALVIEQAIFFFPKPIWLIFSPFFLLRSFIFFYPLSIGDQIGPFVKTWQAALKTIYVGLHMLELPCQANRVWQGFSPHRRGSGWMTAILMIATEIYANIAKSI